MMTTALAIHTPQPQWMIDLEKYAKSENQADKARRLIDAAVTEYKLDGVVALFSGGHDSLTCTHVASKHPLFKGVIHIDTGTGIPETRRFVEETCKREGWPLIIEKPATTYEMLIIKHGFPGPAQHSYMYRMLKERPLTQALIKARKQWGVKKLGMAAGARAQESVRRMGHGQSARKDKMGVWVNLIWDWEALDCNRYITTHKLPRNLVKDTMHISGECLCGCFSKKEEMRMLEIFYPNTAKRIKAQQTLVKTTDELGLNSIAYNLQQWGHGGDLGKSSIPDAQMELLPMCWFCRGDDDAA